MKENPEWIRGGALYGLGWAAVYLKKLKNQ